MKINYYVKQQQNKLYKLVQVDERGRKKTMPNLKNLPKEKAENACFMLERNIPFNPYKL